MEEETRINTETSRLQSEGEARVAAKEEAKVIVTTAGAEQIKLEEEVILEADEEAVNLQAEEEARIVAELVRVKTETARLQSEE